MVTLKATTLLKMRQTPGFAGQTLGYIGPGVLTYAVGGFKEADGLTWLHIAAPCQDGTWRDGWCAGGQDGEVYLAGYEFPFSLDYPLGRSMPITQMFGENPDIYSRFKLMGHNGLDFGCPVGVPVVAIDAGQATHVRTDPSGYGNYVRIDHTWGISLYAHMERFAISEGEWVRRGMGLGTSGNSGGSTGPHLHFEIRIFPTDDNNGFGGRIDPLAFLPANRLMIPDYVPGNLRALFVGQ